MANESKVRSDAILHCQYLGGRLAELQTQEKLADIKTLLAKMVKDGNITKSQSFHIGKVFSD